jgi:thiamine pyrophosphate-dependent acetolactate synthase large subunit-like protein
MMSETEMRDLVVIDPEAIFRQRKMTVEQTREALSKLEAQMEEQRLLAWTKHIIAPENEELKKNYRGLCREQGRMMTAFNQWRAANPEAEE